MEFLIKPAVLAVASTAFWKFPKFNKSRKEEMMKRIWRYWVLGVLSLWAVAGMAQYPVKWEIHTVNWSPGYCYYDTSFKQDSLYVNNRLIEIGIDLEALDSRRYIMAFYQCPSVVITTDYGESWQRIFDFGGSTRVGNVEMHVVDVEWVTPQVLYILIDSVEVFGDRTSTVLLRSRDGGESFEAIPIWTRAQTQQSGWELVPIDISFADSLNGIMGFIVVDGRKESDQCCYTQWTGEIAGIRLMRCAVFY